MLSTIFDARMRRFSWTLAAAALATAGGGAFAQTRVRTEIIRPAAVPKVDNHSDDVTGTIPAAGTHAVTKNGPPPEVITDFSTLPPAVASTRARILAAARTGRLEALVNVMQASETLPIFSLNDDKDPTAYWRRNYPDSEGVEILAILTDILETGAVHVDQGTPDEMYVWPYFARLPLKSLTPAQKVELFKIVTGGDYKDMLNAGTYDFFRLGIGPDGAWHFFVTGD
jgi:hypothetical protein